MQNNLLCYNCNFNHLALRPSFTISKLTLISAYNIWDKQFLLTDGISRVFLKIRI